MSAQLVRTIGGEVLLVLLAPVPCVSPAGLLEGVLRLVRLVVRARHVLALQYGSALPLSVGGVFPMHPTAGQPVLSDNPGNSDKRYPVPAR